MPSSALEEKTPAKASLPISIRSCVPNESTLLSTMTNLGEAKSYLQHFLLLLKTQCFLSLFYWKIMHLLAGA